jgi:hypothetical protein
MWCSEYLDAIQGGGWGVFIASNHFLAIGWVCCRWAHRIVRWCTGQVLFTVRCTPRQRSVGVWSVLTAGTLCPIAAPHSLVPHRTCPVCSEFLLWLLTCIVPFCSRQLALGYRCSIGSPDMSGAHWTVRWIIAERALRKTREWLVRLVLGLVHCTLSGAPLAAHSQVLCSKFIWVPVGGLLRCRRSHKKKHLRKIDTKLKLSIRELRSTFPNAPT